MSCLPCKDKGECPLVFDRVHVSYLIRGGTRVMWDLVPEFVDPLPYTFQLQVGRTGVDVGGEWENVGLSLENGCMAVDGEQRPYGAMQWTHYRVQLTTPNGIYYSEPTGLEGILARKDWRLARNIIRNERLRHKLATSEGYLLKRRFSGVRCSACSDVQTDECRNPDCEMCYGTGFQCGYYYPVSCVYADLNPSATRKQIDPQSMRGTVSGGAAAPARMLQVPLLEELDVWVNKKTDDRFFIHSIQNLAEWRSVPLIARVELRLAPYTDIIYDVPIPQHEE